MSTLKADTIVAADGTSPVTLTKQSAAKVWCRWDFTETNVVKGSFGVSSLSDDSTGSNTINYSSSMSDANYSAVTSVVRNARVAGPASNSGVTSSNIAILSYNSSGSLYDSTFASTQVNGDLA
jgi:hypothetical protein